MDILWHLLCAHLLGDFTLQTNKVAYWKSKHFFGLVAHSIIILLVYFAFTIKYLSEIWFVIILLWISHFLIDYLRILFIKKFPRMNNIFAFLLDQSLHILAIIAAYKLSFSKLKYTYVNTWIIILTIIILITSFTTILIYYLELFIYKTSKIEAKEKYFGITERFVIMSFFLLPGYLWILFPFALIPRLVIYKKSLLALNFNKLNIIVNITAGVGAGVFFRIFFTTL
ncbi:DUF3307 domain-containing protein [bacterium]